MNELEIANLTIKRLKLGITDLQNLVEEQTKSYAEETDRRTKEWVDICNGYNKTCEIWEEALNSSERTNNFLILIFTFIGFLFGLGIGSFLYE